VAVGSIGQVPLVGLPGNPVAAMVTYSPGRRVVRHCASRPPLISLTARSATAASSCACASPPDMTGWSQAASRARAPAS
jgi:molybdopterin biosynthesis enzyme